MFSILRPIRIRFDQSHDTLEIDYKPRSKKPIYDICDLQGKILKSGKFSANRLKIALSDLLNSDYVLLILDGEEIKSRRFEISR